MSLLAPSKKFRPAELLLVNAPAREMVYGTLNEFSAIEPPVWAGLIARHCMNKGYRVEILDAEAEGLTLQATADEIRKRQPLLVVFCIYGQQPSASTQCLPAADIVAACLPGFVTLALGTHPSALPEKTLKESSFTFVASGEGPQTVVGLLQHLKFGCAKDTINIPGLWWRTPLGEIGPRTPARNIAANALDAELPGQSWELLDMSKYRAHNWHLWTGDSVGGYASVQTSLGCPFRCTFCCINAPFTADGSATNIRYWSPKNVANQIDYLATALGITNIKIPDEMFCLNKRHVEEICRILIARGVNKKLNMWAYARIDTVKDTALLSMMREAGFKWLGIGIESGSKHVRDGVEKGAFGDEQIHAAVERVWGAGIAVAANYIFGLPDDTQESMQSTLDLACELNTEWANFYCAMAYPGSALHIMSKEARLPEGPGGPGWIGYAQHAYEALPLGTNTLTPEQVLDFRDSAFLEYFMRPKYQEMILERFGKAAMRSVIKMVSFGRPPRLHRAEQSEWLPIPEFLRRGND